METFCRSRQTWGCLCEREKKGLGFGLFREWMGCEYQKAQKLGLKTLFAQKSAACTGTCLWCTGTCWALPLFA